MDDKCARIWARADGSVDCWLGSSVLGYYLAKRTRSWVHQFRAEQGNVFADEEILQGSAGRVDWRKGGRGTVLRYISVKIYLLKCVYVDDNSETDVQI